MTAIQIQAPDGSLVEFPEGTDENTIKSVMQREYSARGFRNNNPGNLRAGKVAHPGQQSVDEHGFAVFSTPDAGMAAADSNLAAYGRRGINTLRGVVSRWAPPSENDTEAYIAHAADLAGVRPDQKLDLSDPKIRRKVLPAIFQIETGKEFHLPDLPQDVARYVDPDKSGQQVLYKDEQGGDHPVFTEAQRRAYLDRAKAGHIQIGAEPGTMDSPIPLRGDYDKTQPGLWYMRPNGSVVQGARPNEALGFLKGAAKPLDNAAMALEAGLNRAGLDTDLINRVLGMPSAAQATQGHADFFKQQIAKGRAPGAIGQFAGEVAGTAPVMLATKNPFLGGAASGALLTDERTPQGVAVDAVTGALGGKLGDVATRGLAGAVRGVTNPQVQQLVREGVPMTPGQVAGGVTKRAEDLAASIPLLGDMIRGAQRESVDGFNRAAVQRTLTPIGEKLPKNVPTGHEAIQYAQDQLSAAYQEVLPKLKIKADPHFQSGLASLSPDIANLAPQRAEQVEQIIRSSVFGRFNPDGSISGESMKTIDSELGRLARQYGSSSDADQREMASVLRSVQGELRDMVVRQNPAHAPRLNTINDAYSSLVRVEGAAKMANEGLFTPNQLRTAARVADSSVRKRATAAGTAKMQDLAEAGQSVLPSTVPNSGTADRLMFATLGSGALGGLLHRPEGLAAAAALAALAAPYTRVGRNVVTKALTSRHTSAKDIADILAKFKAPAAIGGSAALVNTTQ